MGLLDFIKWQKIDVIRWENPESFLLIKKFDRPLDEIKDDATLIVEPWYAAIFVHNWVIEAIEQEPWKWSLQTENKPFITSLKNILRWFESPDKAAVFFVKTTEILNQKWGTKNPVKYIDPQYNFPVKLRAFWNFSFRIVDIPKFWQNYVWTRSEVTVDEIRQVIVDRLMQYITDVFAEAKLSYNEIDANRVELADKIKEKLNEVLWNLGIQITDFRIEDINFTEDTEELIRKVAEQSANVQAMNKLKDIDWRAMQNYVTTKQLDVMEKAVQNEGGVWSTMWMFIWANLGSNLGAQMTGVNLQSWQNDIETKLAKLKELLDKGLISKEDYEKKKKEILESL